MKYMDLTTILIISGGVVLLLCLMLTIASFSNEKFITTYNKLIEMETQSEINLSSFINHINQKYLKGLVKICEINNPSGDYYDSKNKVIAINMFGEKNLASIAVVAHELGHAYQDIVDGTLASFNRLRRVGIMIGNLFAPILILGIVLLFFVENYMLVISVCGGVALLIVLLAIIIKAKTIKVEKDATEKALGFLKEVLEQKEVKECKKLLYSARLTYWGDLMKLLLGWLGLTNKTKMFR